MPCLSEPWAVTGRRYGQPAAGDELTDSRAGGQHCSGRSPRSVLQLCLGGGPQCLRLCWGQGGEAGAIASPITPNHMLQPF